MKIAMVGHKHVPGREGGVEIVVGELAIRMAALGYDVTAYNRSGHHVAGSEYDEEELDQYKGVRIKVVPTIPKRGFAALSSSFFACLYAALGDYDIVHIHAEGPARFSFIPKLFHKKVIVTIHGLDWKREKWGRLASYYIRGGERNAVKYADSIIVLSRGIQNYFKNVYNRETVYIPNGVRKPFPMKPEQIKKLWGLEKDSYILFVGRLVPEKGIQYLLKAWKQIKSDKKLVLAGGESDANEFAKTIKSLADERTIFTGFVQGQVLAELYSNAYIYCLPTDLEGMPLTLLEAMSYGNCCLTSDIAECTDVVRDKAVTFRKSDTKDLQRKLESLLSDPERVSRIKAEASDYICNKYDWDNVVRETLELYWDTKKGE